MDCFWISKRFKKKRNNRKHRPLVDGSHPQAASPEKPNTEGRPWADLPGDLLLSIASNLSTFDRGRMSNACKDWRSVPYGILPPLGPAWLMTFREGEGRTKCIDPSCNKTYSMDLPELTGAWIMSSCHGWLLLFRDDLLFFLNPITRERKDLPPLTALEPERERKNHFPWQDGPRTKSSYMKAAFFFLPTSPDCVVAFVDYRECMFGDLRTWCQGSEHWTPYSLPPTIYYDTVDDRFDNGRLHHPAGPNTVNVIDAREKAWMVIQNPDEQIQYRGPVYMVKNIRETWFLISIGLEGVIRALKIQHRLKQGIQILGDPATSLGLKIGLVDSSKGVKRRMGFKAKGIESTIHFPRPHSWIHQGTTLIESIVIDTSL